MKKLILGVALVSLVSMAHASVPDYVSIATDLSERNEALTKEAENFKCHSGGAKVTKEQYLIVQAKYDPLYAETAKFMQREKESWKLGGGATFQFQRAKGIIESTQTAYRELSECRNYFN